MILIAAANTNFEETWQKKPAIKATLPEESYQVPAGSRHFYRLLAENQVY
jgi:hypothetical protein